MLKNITRQELQESMRKDLTPDLSSWGSESWDDHGESTVQLMESMGEDDFYSFLSDFDGLLDRREMKTFRAELKEAGISESAFAVFTRAGVEAVIRDGYAPKTNKYIADQCVMTVPSKRYAENYAWVFEPSLPQPLGDMEEPQETNILPRQLTVVNEDFGLACGLSKRLVDDDNTGEFSNYLSKLGRSHARHEEIYFAGYLTNAVFTHSGVTVPSPTYTDPDGTTGVYVTSGNRANAITPAALTETNLRALLDVMEGIEDPEGKLINPDIDTLVTGTFYRWDAAQILNSAFYPTTAGATNTAFMAVNQLGPQTKVLDSPLDLRTEHHFNQTADKKRWYVGEAKSRSLCRQERQPLEVLMESPTSGWSLRHRGQYQRTYRRFAYAWFDARYWGQGSDGTA